MVELKTVKKRRSRLGGLLEDVKEALSEEQRIVPKERGVSIPSTEVGIERKDYGTHHKVVVRSIDPSKCRPWKYHNRDEHWLNTQKCADLIESIRANAQLEPAGVRRIDNDPNYDYEIIYGVRRWFSCKYLNIPLKARVLDKTDRECMILMHIENADSKDISDFERAFSFRQQLNSGVFKNQADLAKAVHLTQAMISKYVTAASMYDFDFIIKLFPDKTQISIRKANELFKLLGNEFSLKLVKAKALEILATPKLDKMPVSKRFDILLSLLETEKDRSVANKIAGLNSAEGVFINLDSRGQLVIKVNPLSRKKDKDDVVHRVAEILEEYLSLE